VNSNQYHSIHGRPGHHHSSVINSALSSSSERLSTCFEETALNCSPHPNKRGTPDLLTTSSKDLSCTIDVINYCYFDGDWFSSSSYHAISWWSQPKTEATPSAHARVIGAAASSWRAKDAAQVASLPQTFPTALNVYFWSFLTLEWSRRFSCSASGTSHSTFGRAPCCPGKRLRNHSPRLW
jgi:hypothetical protein